MRNRMAWLLIGAWLMAAQCCLADPVITEFLASNDSELADEDGDFSDWIEIHNPDATPVNLAGWYLTDDASDLTEWVFPSVSIPAGGYLVVFASKKDRAVAGSELHTNFKLSSGGEYLALVKPDGVTTTTEFAPFPAQNTDVSYGVNSSVTLIGSEMPLKYLLTTPATDSAGKGWTQHDYDDASWVASQVLLVDYVSANVPRTATKSSWSSGSGSASSTVNVAGQSSPVTSVRLKFNISRSSGSSLLVQLRSPAGTTITVFNNEPDSTAFSKEFNEFNNENLNGDWTLTLTESGGGFFSSNSSTLHSWSLEIPNGTTLTKSGLGYDTGNGYDGLIHTEVSAGTQEAWVRLPFQVADVSELTSLLLKMRYDDGFEAFLNGTLVASANVTPPIQALESSDYVDFDLTAHLSALRTGNNVLAIRLINANSSSSDLLLLPELRASQDISSSDYDFLTEPTPGQPNQSALLNPGPTISEVTENPPRPADSEDLLVTARIQARESGVSSVTLFYRVNFSAEIPLAMKDDGTGGDTVAGDGIYSALIPAAAAGEGEMLRWKVRAQGGDGKISTLPLVLDTSGKSQSPQYYGTVIAQPSVEQGIPVMHWFTQDVGASHTRTGTRASVYYAGKFYDNMFVRSRGGYSNSGSQKFDFNKGHPLFINEEMPSVGEVNMNGNGTDSSYIRQPNAFEFHRHSGNPGCLSFPVNMRLNGNFDRVSILIEQVDEDYLKRNGYDAKNGELYKFTQRANYNPAFDDTSTGVGKKVGDESLASLQALVDDLKQSLATDRINSFYDNMDVQEFINYMAIRAVQQQADDVRKNFYMYKDSGGDGRWRIFPWDLDWTWDIAGAHGEQRADHPFFGTQSHPSNDGNNQWNRLYGVAFEDITMQRLMLRRLRTLMDESLKPTSTGGWFEPRMTEVFNSMNGLSGPSLSELNKIINTEIPERRNELYNDFTTSIPGESTVIPGAQPSNPSVLIDEVDYSPASGDQDQEYIRITNSENTEIDISGWSLSSGVTFTFPAGTVIPRNGEIYVSPKLEKFLTRATSPKAGERRLVTGPYQGHLSSFGEDIVLMNAQSNIIQTFSYVGNPSLVQRHLVISEIHYAPLGNADAEFIELYNTSTTETLDLTGVKFTNGIDFDFTGSSITSLAPLQRVLVVKNINAFESVYGTSLTASIAGVFANGTSLNNGGEALKLDDATGSTVRGFSYDNEAPWPVSPGHSIELIYSGGAIPDHGDPTNWMSSEGLAGSPLGVGPLFRGWLSARGQTDPLAQKDGWSELLTYGLGRDLAGGSFILSSALETFNVGGEEGVYLTLQFSVRDGSDVDVLPQISNNLTDWSDAVEGVDVLLLSDVDAGNGTRTKKYRTIQKTAPGGTLFMRIAVREN